jgi:hypothetical protein
MAGVGDLAMRYVLLFSALCKAFYRRATIATCSARFDVCKTAQSKSKVLKAKVVEEGIEEVLSVSYIMQA